MNTFVPAVIFLALALAGVIIRKTYYQVPVKELKRRAARHDPVAEQLYKAVAYGNSTKVLLWIFIGLTSAASVVLFAQHTPIIISLLAVALALWVLFSLLPQTRLTQVGTRLTLLATPAIAWVLNVLHPALYRAGDKVEKRYVDVHTRLFERDDLLELIERQQNQSDSRFTAEELEIAKRALKFSDNSVADILTPRKEVSCILADDAVGPVVIDELHKTGQKFALVKDTKKGPFTGSLEVGRLGIQSTGKIRDFMQPTVYYVHENDTLGEALHAFSVTNHPIFVVVNSFEEYVGIITVENVLEQLLGHIPGDDFDQYADLSAVAARHNRKDEPDEPKDESESNEEPAEDPEATSGKTEEKVVE